MNFEIIYWVIIVLFFVVIFVQRYYEGVTAAFYKNPIGKQCRYKYTGKWIKGVVEWNNGQYYYITPAEKKLATDLVHKNNVKPRYWKL